MSSSRHPKLTDEFNASGVVTDDAPMAMYPIFADDAVDRHLYPNTWLTLTGQVTADDGSTWYRTDAGDYVPTDDVFVPERADAYTGPLAGRRHQHARTRHRVRGRPAASTRF